MNMLVLYDQSGFVFSMSSGGHVPEESLSMWVNVPQDKLLTRIDTSKTPHEPVFEDVPDLMKEVEDLKQSIAELSILIATPQS